MPDSTAAPWTVARQTPLFHSISQASILESVTIFFSRGSSQPKDWTLVSCIGRQILYHWATREAIVVFYSVGIFRTSSMGGSISSNPERTAWRRLGEKPGYIEFLWQRADSLNIKRWLLIKETQIFQSKEFRTFLCMGRCKSLGSLKSFLW